MNFRFVSEQWIVLEELKKRVVEWHGFLAPEKKKKKSVQQKLKI
jgi:hypothetical protein